MMKKNPSSFATRVFFSPKKLVDDFLVPQELPKTLAAGRRLSSFLKRNSRFSEVKQHGALVEPRYDLAVTSFFNGDYLEDHPSKWLITMVSKAIPPKSPYFRFRNYTNLPRYLGGSYQ